MINNHVKENVHAEEDPCRAGARLALFTAGQAMAADYKIDKEGQHAFIEFRIKHLGYSWLYGRFNDFDGSFTFDEKNRRPTRSR